MRQRKILIYRFSYSTLFSQGPGNLEWKFENNRGLFNYLALTHPQNERGWVFVLKGGDGKI